MVLVLVRNTRNFAVEGDDRRYGDHNHAPVAGPSSLRPITIIATTTITTNITTTTHRSQMSSTTHSAAPGMDVLADAVTLEVNIGTLATAAAPLPPPCTLQYNNGDGNPDRSPISPSPVLRRSQRIAARFSRRSDRLQELARKKEEAKKNKGEEAKKAAAAARKKH
ncbi:hypothetical protein ABW21_db0203538 [Orbilia brochopaga]|nr:hypothetical protein ABW21_db0203538 [Drechslerella brochopaga]